MSPLVYSSLILTALCQNNITLLNDGEQGLLQGCYSQLVIHQCPEFAHLALGQISLKTKDLEVGGKTRLKAFGFALQLLPGKLAATSPSTPPPSAR